MAEPAVPTVAHVDLVTAMDEPVLRNLRVTQCYHRLSAALVSRTGVSANWCTFATWASKQAGRTIRREDVRLAVERALGGSAVVQSAVDAVVVVAREAGLPRGVADVQAAVGAVVDPAAIAARSADAVAAGNRKVFAEIGRAFARWFEAGLPAGGDGAGNAALEAFLAELEVGPPPDGQSLLREAFALYGRVLLEPHDPARAQWLLHANLLIGLHEQTRLQPEIAAALNAAVPDAETARTRLLAALAPGAAGVWSRWRAWFRRLTGRRTPLERASDALVEAVRAQVRGALTAHLMTLELAGTTVRLGRDLAAVPPASLRSITDPALRALLERIDPTPDSVGGTGAADWADLEQRMHFIADLFRCFQESAPLQGPPFTPDQAAAIDAGRVPGGRL